jgi:cytohesin
MKSLHSQQQRSSTLRWCSVLALSLVTLPVLSPVVSAQDTPAPVPAPDAAEPARPVPVARPTPPTKPTPVPLPALVVAINKGDLAAATAALDKEPAQINAAFRGSTPLLLAVRGGKKEIVAMLLAKGADANLAANDSMYDYASTYTPLQMALNTGYSYSSNTGNPQKEILSLLLDKGAKPDVPDNEGSTPLLRMVTNGNRDLAELLLNKGASINARDRSGRTALGLAIGNGNGNAAEMIALLLSKGADIKARDAEGRSPLHNAVLRGGNHVKLLLEKGADINARTVTGDTPLHLAAASPSAVIDVLLDAGADAQVVNKRGDTPLHVALRAFDTENAVVNSDFGGESFQYRGASAAGRSVRTRPEGLLTGLIAKSDINAKDQFGQPCLILALTSRDVEARHDIFDRQPRLDKTMEVFDAAAQSDAEALKKLLDERPFLTYTRLFNGMTPLHISALWGARATTDLLLKKGADINARDARAMTPLHRAINSTAVPTRVREIVAMLLEKGAPVNALDINDNTPLNRLLLQPVPDKQVLSMLLDKDADANLPNRMGQRPLVTAAGNSLAKELVPLLLAKGAEINTRDRSGTALQRAYARRDKETVQLLLDKNAEMNDLDNEGESMLTRLVSNYSYGSSNDTANRDLLILLLDRGGDINGRARSGETLLHRATSTGNKELVTLLLDRKADINLKDRAGYTALMRSITMGNNDMVTLLLDRGADVTLKNNGGQTALQMAERQHLTAVADLLRQRGAKE